jgi:hypothetical protein
VAFGAEGLADGKAMKLLVNTCTIGVPFVDEIENATAVRARVTSARDDFTKLYHASRETPHGPPHIQ